MQEQSFLLVKKATVEKIAQMIALSERLDRAGDHFGADRALLKVAQRFGSGPNLSKIDRVGWRFNPSDLKRCVAILRDVFASASGQQIGPVGGDPLAAECIEQRVVFMPSLIGSVNAAGTSTSIGGGEARRHDATQEQISNHPSREGNTPDGTGMQQAIDALKAEIDKLDIDPRAKPTKKLEAIIFVVSNFQGLNRRFKANLIKRIGRKIRVNDSIAADGDTMKDSAIRLIDDIDEEDPQHDIYGLHQMVLIAPEREPNWLGRAFGRQKAMIRWETVANEKPGSWIWGVYAAKFGRGFNTALSMLNGLQSAGFGVGAMEGGMMIPDVTKMPPKQVQQPPQTQPEMEVGGDENLLEPESKYPIGVPTRFQPRAPQGP